MFINPRPSLVTVTIDGISLVMDSKDAKELKQRHYPHAEIKRLRKRSTKEKVGHGPVVRIDPVKYIELTRFE